MEPVVKSPGPINTAFEKQKFTGGFAMKAIAAAMFLMCALSAYVSYPSATGGAALALSMQESRSLPI
jgi:hypothetical protein